MDESRLQVETVQNDGEVTSLFDPIEMVGGGSQVIIHDFNVDINEEDSEREIIPSSEEPKPSEKVLGSKKRSKYHCLICGKTFNQNAGRYNHMKKKHNIYRGDKTNIRCLEKGCSFKCSYKEKLQLHLVEEHGFSMDITIKNFKSYNDFLQWKEDFEKQEKTRFVKKSGSRSREKGVRVVYFYCSRSGAPIGHNNSEKQGLKKKGTTKSDHHCTASITCLELANGNVEVKVCATHYGHDADLQHLRLSKTDKIQIVEKLMKGVPREVVIDNIRSSASADVDRIHLITMKDIKNIEKAYKIQPTGSSETTSNITENIGNWVVIMSTSEHSPVVYFQEQGTSDLVDYDFTLVLMTIGQIEMAKKYGHSGIFYIPTYATNDNKYFVYSQKSNTHEIHIATLIVVDSSNEVSPICFMISTRICMEKFKLFFECVKKNVPELKAKAILTDDNFDIFEAWTSVFTDDSAEKPFHLWSNRFVDKDWRDNLIALPNEEVQESIYEKLYWYLESHDESKIHSTLRDYVDKTLLTNPLTIPFGNHFTLKYLGCEQFWAGCYGKKMVAIQAQLNMERLSNEIEEVVDRKHVDKRFIVRTVQDLLKLISENQCQRQAKIHRQIQELPNHHSLGMKINPDYILSESNCWRVNSSKDPENIFSIVTKAEDKCCDREPCILYCMKCGTCAHEFHCSCRFYAFDKTMCKHIHAVAMNFIDQTHLSTSKEDNSQSAGKESDTLKRMFVRRRRSKKSEERPPVKLESDVSVEENILPELELTPNRKTRIAKRKRGVPRENAALENGKSKEPSEDSTKSYRSKVNILRKSKKSQALLRTKKTSNKKN